MESEAFKHYTESIYYDLEFIGKYVKHMANDFFKKTNCEISPEEYVALDIIFTNPEICQRDLAKLMLKDRANTGRIVNDIMLKGCIERFTDKKGNRSVKKMKITEKGIKILQTAKEKMMPIIFDIENKFDESDKETLKNSLIKLKSVLIETVSTTI